MNINFYSFRQPLQPNRTSVRQPQFGMAVSRTVQNQVDPSYMTRYAEEAIFEHQLFRLFSLPNELSELPNDIDVKLKTYTPEGIARNFIEAWTEFSNATSPAIREHPVIQEYLSKGLATLLRVLETQREDTQSVLKALAKRIVTSNPDFPDGFAQPLLEAAGLMEKTEARTYGALEGKA
jgi:hypothetical protein